MRTKLLLLQTALWLGLIASSAVANSARHSDEVFLQSLAEEVSALVEDSLPALGQPEATSLACTITRACGDGNSVACTGNFSCQYSLQGVECDNTNHPCPNFCSLGWSCDECPGYGFFCFSTYGDCGITNSGCNGRPQVCRCPRFG